MHEGIGGRQHRGKGGGSTQIDALRHREHGRGLGDGHLRVRAALGDGGDRLTDGQALDPRADGPHMTGQLQPGDKRQARHPIADGPGLQVREIHSDIGDIDGHLARARLRQLELHQPQDLRPTELIETHTAHTATSTS